MERMVGIKEIYDVNLRLTEPLTLGDRLYEINESILRFDTAEIAQLREEKRRVRARGGFGNRTLIDWELDTECTFALTHGKLSLSSWAIIGNSKVKTSNLKSISYHEELNVIEDENYWYVDLKYMPNHIDGQFGLQYNLENSPLPMGRKEWLPLKPLPPEREKFIFCYDAETGKKILKFELLGNRVLFKGEHRKVIVDYTFNYNNQIKELQVGNPLLNNYLSLTAKITTKDWFDGKVKTALLEIPKIKLKSDLEIRFGKDVDKPVVSDFYFIGYPQEGMKEKDGTVCKIFFLDSELTGEYN